MAGRYALGIIRSSATTYGLPRLTYQTSPRRDRKGGCSTGAEAEASCTCADPKAKGAVEERGAAKRHSSDELDWSSKLFLINLSGPISHGYVAFYDSMSLKTDAP